MNDTVVRLIDTTDLDWVERVLDDEFGGRMQARRGELVDALACPGFVAERSGERVGALTYSSHGGDSEVVFIVATVRRVGVGSRLLERFLAHARGAGASRAWVVTTNDNVVALAFYQHLGFRIVELRRGAVDHAREHLKSAIGRVGDHGIPIRDELELALDLA